MPFFAVSEPAACVAGAAVDDGPSGTVPSCALPLVGWTQEALPLAHQPDGTRRGSPLWLGVWVTAVQRPDAPCATGPSPVIHGRKATGHRLAAGHVPFAYALPGHG